MSTLNVVEGEIRTIAGVQQAIKDDRARVAGIVSFHQSVIEKNNRDLNAVTVVEERAIDIANKLDQSAASARGPLFGITVLVKDQIETEGLRTSFGSKACKDYVPEQDATIVCRLKEAGAVILGKTTMPDWAASWFSTSSLSGTTKNPYDHKRDPGGSSSGSGAAIAAGMAVVAIGGDTGGSVRLPASFCGLVGVRVTPGRISRAGMSALVTPQDTPGPMARTVEDAAKVLDVLVGYDEADPYTSVNAIAPLGEPRASTSSTESKDSTSSTAPPHPRAFQNAIAAPSLIGKRLGILREAFGSDPEITTVLDTTLKTLSDAGATLIDITIPNLEHYKTYTSAYVTRSKSDINEFLASRPALSHLKIEELHAKGAYHKSLDLLDAFVKGPSSYDHNPHYTKQMLVQAEFQRVVASVFAREKLDAVVYPTCQVLPPKTDDILNGRWLCLDFPTNTVIASQLLFPAVSVPVGFAKDHEDSECPDLPVGLEILGLPLREESLMAVAAGVEVACAKQTRGSR